MTVTPYRASSPEAASTAHAGKTARSIAHPKSDQADTSALGFLAELAAAVTSIGSLAQVTGALPGTTASLVGELTAATGSSASTPSSTPGTALLTTSSPSTAPLATSTAALAAQATAAGPLATPLAVAGVPASVAVASSALTQTTPSPLGASSPASSAAGSSAGSSVDSAAAAVANVLPAARLAQDDTRSDLASGHDEKAHDGAAQELGGAQAPAIGVTPEQLAAAAVVPSTAPVATAPTSQTARTTAVLQQVFPEVSKLATAGNGTHRMTLTLHPQDLGTVRVTLTVRDGSVQVSMASDQATSSLVQGSSDLHRLLEAHGAVDSRVVVRDLASGVLAADSSSGPGTQTAGDRQPGQPQGQQQAQQTATGGFGDGTRGGQPGTGSETRRSDAGPAAYERPVTAAQDTGLTPTTTERRSGVDRLI